MAFQSFDDRTFDLEESNENNYDDLIVSIMASAGKFHLLLGVCDYAEDRKEIIRRYEEELTPDFACYQVTLARGEPSLRAAIAELTETETALQQPTKAVVTVTGTEQLYFLRFDEARSEQEKFFGYLQWTREALREFQFTIILWITQQMERDLNKRSPDFWSWNKGVFHFQSHKKKSIPAGEIMPIREMFGDRWIDGEIDEDDPYFLPIDDLKELIRLVEEKGGDHASLATFYTQLGKIYNRRIDKGECENYREEQNLAIEYFQKAIGFQKSLSLELDLAYNLNYLATLYYWQGKYEAAEPLFLQSLELRKKLLGEDHPSVATSLNNLAGLYESQGKYEAAEPLFLQSLELRKKLLGEDHPSVATSLNNLAGLYESQGKYEAAEPLFLQSLELRKKLLGEDHPDVATSLNNLAYLYKSQGKYEAAEPLYLQSLELRKKLLGEDHPDVATPLNNLALLYHSQGKYEAAEPLYLQSLDLMKKLLGEGHPYTKIVSNNLVYLQKKIKKSSSFWERSKRWFKNRFQSREVKK
jgi:tetratricopeptide (TPR) repeat protein